MSKINNIEVPEFAVSVQGAVITNNFEQIKGAVQEVAKSYEIVQYSDDPDDQIKQLKSDRATLNKYKDTIDNKRKEIKNICLKPISDMEQQFKELIAILDVPCGSIDTNIKAIEDKQRSDKKKLIMEFYREAAVVLEDSETANFLWKKLYKSEWENKTCTKKKYQDAIREGIKNYMDGMSALNAIQSDFKEEGIREFKESLNLAQAMDMINRLQAQQDEAVERAKKKMQEEQERQIREAEERAKREEQRKLEEARRAEAAAQERAAMEAARARKAEEDRKKAEAAAKAAVSANTPKVFVKIEDGVVSIWSDMDISLNILDMDMSPSDKEIVAFGEAIQELKELY